MSKKQKNYDCSRKTDAELELIKSQIAESRSKRFKNYCVAVGSIVGILIKLYLGV